jgi:hypothetical protein
LDALRTELSGCTFRNVQGFYQKYFKEMPWSSTVDDHLSSPLGIVFHDLIGHFLVESRPPMPIQIPSVLLEPTASEVRHQYISNMANMYVLVSDRPISSSQTTAANARILGNASFNTAGSETENILRLCENARGIFQSQPTRRFLHAFQLCDRFMEPWVFDRSGAYSGGKIDIKLTPDLASKTIASYGMMNDAEAGLESFIKMDEMGRYVSIKVIAGNPGREKLYLEDKAIAAPCYIVGPGTTCYPARRPGSTQPDLAVKFAWREQIRHTEWEILAKITALEIWGVTKVLGFQDLASIEDQRQGLQFPRPYEFITSAAGQSVSPEGEEPSKETALDEQYNHSFVNRTLSCTVNFPLGRSINKFESVLEFLEACRDVVKALRSLYQDGKILHRDICIKNLIIAPQHNEGDAKGVLIDFDAALDLEKGPARRGELIGSEGFMAIGILSGDAHTYRHDLESLFYVFLWISISTDREHDDIESLRNQPTTSRLWGWCSTNFKSVRENKMVDMSPDGFVQILAEFSNEFEHVQGLAVELKNLLFPWRDGELFTGTDMDQNGADRLYSGMIDTFNRSITVQADRKVL